MAGERPDRVAHAPVRSPSAAPVSRNAMCCSHGTPTITCRPCRCASVEQPALRRGVHAHGVDAALRHLREVALGGTRLEPARRVGAERPVCHAPDLQLLARRHTATCRERDGLTTAVRGVRGVLVCRSSSLPLGSKESAPPQPTRPYNATDRPKLALRRRRAFGPPPALPGRRTLEPPFTPLLNRSQRRAFMSIDAMSARPLPDRQCR